VTYETASEWMEAAVENGMRHTRSLPASKRWERLYFRIFGHNPQSVVDRRMDALHLDEQERKAWLRDNPPPRL
jgi:hypothetical protein